MPKKRGALWIKSACQKIDRDALDILAKNSGIAIYARATASAPPGADPSADGTVVRRDSPRAPGVVVGVASERDVLVLEMEGRSEGRSKDRPLPEGLPDILLALLDEHAVAGKQLHQHGEGWLSLVISRENLHDEARVRAALSARFGATVSLSDRLGAVSVVGAGINASFSNLRRGSAALAAAGAQPHGVATSSFRITWMVDRARLDDAVRALHREFLE